MGGGTVAVRLAQIPDAKAPGGKRDALPSDFVARYDPDNSDAPLLRESDFEVVLANKTVTTLADAKISFSLDELQAQLVSHLDSATVKATAGSSGPLGLLKGKLSLDLNKFLRVGDTLQVVYRRIH